MTIVKLSKSGKQLQIVDDFGNVYGIAVQAIQGLLDGKVNQGFSMCTRLPFKVDNKRFGVSPLWDPDGTFASSGTLSSATLPDSSINLSNDAFSAKVLNKESAVKKFEDKIIW